MKRFAVVVMSLTVGTVFGTGCGSSLPKLTAEQKAIVSDTMHSISRATNAANSLAKSPSSMPSLQPGSMPSATPDFGGFPQPMPLPSMPPMPSAPTLPQMPTMPGALSLGSSMDVVGSSQDQVQAKMAEQLSQSATSCQVTGAPVATSMGAGATGGSFSVSGGQCPIAFTMSSSMNTIGSSVSMTLNMKYQVQDAQGYGPLNDVDSFDFGVKVSVSGGSESASLSGSIHSQKNGNVVMTVKGDGEGNGNGGKMTVTIDLKYPSFTAEFKMSQDGNNQEYSINDEKVGKDEFVNTLNGTFAGIISSGS